jgi:hypothetical protein
MKLCKDCSHHGAMVDILSQEKRSICLLKSSHNLDPVTGRHRYTSHNTILCRAEREDDVGFFGFWVDKTRCGVEAINFEGDGEAGYEENNIY